MCFGKAVKKMFNYSEKCCRKEFWLNTMSFVITFILEFIASLAIFSLKSIETKLILLIYFISVIVNIFFLMLLQGLHVQRINDCNKPAAFFLIPFYRFYFLFSEKKSEEKEVKKSQYLIIFSSLYAILISAVLSFILLVFSELFVQSMNGKIYEAKLKSAKVKTERLIKKREPSNKIDHLTDENYKFEEFILDFTDYIKNNYIAEESTNYDSYYGNDLRIYNIGGITPEESQGITLEVAKGEEIETLIIKIEKNNQFLEKSNIKIGDSKYDLYSTFGKLHYQINGLSDFITFSHEYRMEDNQIRIFYVEFYLDGDTISRISAQIQYMSEEVYYTK